MTVGADPADDELLAALDLDDSFVPVRTLAQGDGGTTELVARREARRGEPALLVRKRMPAPLANEPAWRALQAAELAGTGEATAVPAAKAEGVSRLPHVRELYWLPDALVAVYDYVEGPTLGELVRERGPLAPARAAALARQLCQALAPLHAAGVVHRDVAPGNVVVAADGAHLIDLGIARVRVEGATHDTTRLGTWGFAAPEQYGFAQTDARSDVFSLGRLLAYALTAADPADASFECAADLPRVPAAVRAVIKKATAFEPSARYQTVGELERALAAACPPEPVPTAVRAEVPVAPGGGVRAKVRGASGLAAKPAVLWHAFRSGGAVERAASVFLLLFAAVGTAMLTVTAALMFNRSLLDTLTAVLCVAMAVWFAVALGWEPVCCLLSVGCYDVSRGRVRVLLRREAVSLLWLMVAAVVIVLAAAFALQGS